jgi:membrane protease YdiL (CAAX protease family)
VIWELSYGLQFLMLELFFRGFLIFALARVIGSLAIFVMIVPYAMIHFSKPLPECLGSIIAGLALGTVALRTGSIAGGVLVHCAVAWSMDLLALYRTGKLFALFQ